jgi:hypothetical protein
MRRRSLAKIAKIAKVRVFQIRKRLSARHSDPIMNDERPPHPSLCGAEGAGLDLSISSFCDLCDLGDLCERFFFFS